MLRDRIVPLIIAVALFMENMDSTVIATSLPAIATDIGTNPLALKLAVTSYLLSLAIFIPVSGWTADRFGARTVFRAAIAVFVLGSIGCALSSSLTDFVIARVVQGMGGAMMTPVGRMVLIRTISKRDLVGAMAWVTTPALIGPVLGPRSVASSPPTRRGTGFSSSMSRLACSDTSCHALHSRCPCRKPRAF